MEHNMYVMIFSISLPEIFLVMKRTELDININTLTEGLYVNTCYSCQFLIKLEFSRHIFEKFSLTKFL
jgi:hypothetical protein